MKRVIATLFWTVLLATAAFAAAAGDVADAAMKRNADTLRTLVQQKADVNAAQADGTTALHWAARWDDVTMADLLIKAGANAGAANREGATPMFLATVNGSAPMIEALLKGGADVNAAILSNDETALMMAARTGKLDAVKALVDHGAKLSATEKMNGTTALMWAAEQGHADVVKFLIEKGADIHFQSKVIRPIRRGGLNLNARPGPDGEMTGDPMGGLTALLFAVRQGSLETVKVLLAAGADVSKPAVDGSSPLLVAVQNGQYEIGKLLIEHGANPNQANVKDWTPLYLAVTNRNALTTAVPAPNPDGVMDFIKLLLDRGANPNHRVKVRAQVQQANTSLWVVGTAQEEGATPLLRASLWGDVTLVRVLLGYGANPLLATDNGTTPLMAASGVGWAEGFTFEYSPDQTVELVKLLLDAGANINEQNEDGITALHGAAYKGANKVVQLLVDRGADLSAKDKGKDYGFGVTSVRMTPLNWAEGVPIGMSSAIYHTDTVELMAKLMQERGLPVEYHSFKGKKPGEGEVFATPPPPPTAGQPAVQEK